jgi:hypothetical protein
MMNLKAMPNHVSDTWIQPSRWEKSIVYITCTYMFLFAAVNFFILVYIPFVKYGPNGELLQTSSDNTLLQVSVIFLKVLAILIALATIKPWGQKVPNWILASAVWGVCGVMLYPLEFLLLKGFADMGMESVLSVFPDLTQSWGSLLIYSIVFIPVGVLYGLTASLFMRKSKAKPIWGVAGFFTALGLLNLFFI